ncbi:hypothetical protein [Devosia sp. SD17-2]|uniref:hypothetical protein n=1 Tax=Devosia sp. SD17-2 TaxID=2976459 RepID=UPI0023D8AB1D|nr:hypothetical protein [Devosia sp. SD17-2]WEJ31939.1 hypothetical protein NYQ88_13600 [Devosia sp. SD17-2]
MPGFGMALTQVRNCRWKSETHGERRLFFRIVPVPNHDPPWYFSTSLDAAQAQLAACTCRTCWNFHAFSVLKKCKTAEAPIQKSEKEQTSPTTTERTEQRPLAGPHARKELTDTDKTPGTGSLPEGSKVESDVGPD